MPPIINSEHSKITLNTKNVFIDVTATDETKLGIVVNIMATMFSEYCEEPFTYDWTFFIIVSSTNNVLNRIEPVKIVYPDGSVKITPDISTRHMSTSASYINACTGTSLPPQEIVELLEKMSLTAAISPKNPDALHVGVPSTRPDIMHECDIMEDAAIAFGYNNLPKSFPSTNTVAQALPVSKVSDLVRREWAQAGWVEVLPFILCSHEENFEWLNRVDDSSYVVKIANPKTMEFQVVRTSLIPGLLKSVRENRSHPLPIKIFEASDVVFKDTSLERQAKNVRHAAAVWCNKTAGFEVIHGLLDRLMAMVDVPKISATDTTAPHGYYLKEKNGELLVSCITCEECAVLIVAIDPTFFPGRAATVFYREAPSASSPQETQSTLSKLTQGIKSAFGGDSGSAPEDKAIGVLGILHPSVLENFEIGFPCSALEINLEPFKKEVQPVWINP